MAMLNNQMVYIYSENMTLIPPFVQVWDLGRYGDICGEIAEPMAIRYRHMVSLL